MLKYKYVNHIFNDLMSSPEDKLGILSINLLHFTLLYLSILLFHFSISCGQ